MDSNPAVQPTEERVVPASTTPDLLRDIVPTHQADIQLCCRSSYNAQQHVAQQTDARLQRTIVATPGEQNRESRDVESADEAISRKRKRRRMKTTCIRVFCCLGWLFFCPCWTFGVCVREHPNSVDDLREDPCWPCFYKTENTSTDRPTVRI